MKIHQVVVALSVVLALSLIAACVHPVAGDAVGKLDPADFKQWLLPAEPPSPAKNKPTPERIQLGKMLFFDPRLSHDNSMACVSCHSPMFGWSDGLAKSLDFNKKFMARSSPTIVNLGYNTIMHWDGRKDDLESMALGLMESRGAMNTDLEKFFKWINTNQGYQEAFAKAYPGEPLNGATAAKALAAYERTILSRDSAFDRWVAGDRQAMTPQQLRGLAIFMNPDKGNCAACHAAPNFTDNGFHNIGLASLGQADPDLGRYKHKPLPSMKGAFKTPTLRDIEYTAPYFHDGSANTLMDVVEHYDRGGAVRTNLSPNIKPLHLTQEEKQDLVAFMKALSSPVRKVEFPVLPL